MRQFNEIPSIHITEDRLGKRPSFNCEILKKPENFQRFIAIFRSMLAEIDTYEKA